MKHLRRIIIGISLVFGLLFSPLAYADNNRGNRGGGGGGNHRTGTEQRSSNRGNSANRGNSSTRQQPNKGNQGNKKVDKGNGTTRPQHSQFVNDGGQKDSGKRPDKGSGNVDNGRRPGNSGNGGNVNNGNRPGNGGNHGNGGNVNNGNRPGNGGNNGNHGNKPGNNWNGSAPRPGHGSNVMPYYSTRPKPVGHHWSRPLPPPPPRYAGGYRPYVPTIGEVLGVTFGSLINYGVSQLIGAGYNVLSAVDNIIYLNNVNQFGVVWPYVTMYYAPGGGMTGARFQYSSGYNNWGNYNSAYTQLCRMYGAPVSVERYGNNAKAVWWGGNNNGYITLSYSPGYDQYGNPYFYTDMIYGQ